ncbi:hypothetical protein ACEUZ9_000313 [Paracoccus litorisediminis]|uniref:hypothetical protein n=1 Tax=Paracoccus litorisediminis TaxID=2006130 RepID=UPI003731BC59
MFDLLDDQKPGLALAASRAPAASIPPDPSPRESGAIERAMPTHGAGENIRDGERPAKTQIAFMEPLPKLFNGLADQPSDALCLIIVHFP